MGRRRPSKRQRATQPRPQPQAGYDATAHKKRRKPAPGVTASEDWHIEGSHRKLIAGVRDINRNFDLAAWAVREHLNFTSTFSFQSSTGDAALDRDIESYMAWWMRRENCDISGRQNFAGLVRQIEFLRMIDGDEFIIKRASGHIQILEADRVQTPNTRAAKDAGVDAGSLVHGIDTDRDGRMLALAVHKRSRTALEFEMMLPARHVIHHGYFTRADQIRGVSPVAAAYNRYRDLYETLDLSLVKAKLHAMFGVAFLRQNANLKPDFDTVDSDTGEEPTDEALADGARDYTAEVKLNPYAPFKVEMDPGDDIKLLESAHPSDQFQHYTDMMIRIALLACDIPYTFYDVKGSTYSGARQDLLRYQQSARVRQRQNIALLNELTDWTLSRAIASGALRLPRGRTLPELRLDWIPSALPWIDPLKEVKATREAIAAGLTSEIRACHERGYDYREIMEERAEAARIREANGIAEPGVSAITEQDLQEEETAA